MPAPVRQPEHRATLRSADRLRVVVCGYLVRGPIGGMAWHHLQYVLGLVALGHEVLFLEDSEDYPACYDPTTHQVTTDPTYGLEFARQAFAHLGLASTWAYYDAHTCRWHGPAGGRAVDFCSTADVLLNVSGVNPLRDWTAGVPRRALIDTDPVFTQVRHLVDPAARARAASHTHFFTFGELCHDTECGMPADGFAWQATRQPVVLDAWPVTPSPAGAPYTTVMQWNSYQAVEYDGRRFGMKSESFAKLHDLPGRVDVPLQIALGSSAAPRVELQQAGWQVVDPLEVTRDPWTYRRYLQQSRGELSVAKQGYVAGRTGWFSERSACYLASGRPVIVEETGFSRLLPTGRGLHPFTNQQEAVAAIHLVEGDYQRQCSAARELAGELFSAHRVLPRLIDALASPAKTLSPSSPSASHGKP